MNNLNDSSELKVKLTKREAEQCITELEAHLVWFMSVAVPFYVQVFTPSNNARNRPTSEVGMQSESLESAGG